MASAKRVVAGLLLLVLAVLPLIGFNATGTGRTLAFFADPLKGLWGQGLAAAPLRGELSLPGLHGRVVVVRDSYGVPHLFAENEHDLFQAFGFIQACDRLWQMDLQRRIVEGRLAELVGEPGLSSDKWMRMLGLGRVAEESWRLVVRLAEEGDEWARRTRAAVEAYTLGVNQCIDYMARTGRLPLEYRLLGVDPEPWSPVDSMAVAKLIDYVLSFNDNDLLWGLVASRTGGWVLGLYMDYAEWVYREGRVIVGKGESLYRNESLAGFRPEQPVAHPRDSVVLDYTVDLEGLGEALKGFIEAKMEAESIAAPLYWALREGFSNNWVVGGSLTASGHPLLANDPHLALTAPPVWYEVHLVSRDTGLNVYGVAFPGVPFVVIGRNQYISFGYTNSMVDVVDLYYYVWNGSKYYYNGSWLEPRRSVEEILVRRGNGYDRVELEVFETMPGRIVEFDTGAGKYRVAVKATTLMPEPIAVWAYMVNHARSVYDYLEAQRYFYSPIQNAVVADGENILYSPSGLVPIRTRLPLVDVGDGRLVPNTGFLPFNGSRAEGEWIGFLSFKDIPRLLNPGRGFVATANNMIIHNYTLDGAPVYLQWSFLDSYRWMRIAELVEEKSRGKGLTAEDMRAIQMDVKSKAAEELVPVLVALAEKAGGLGGLERKALDMLKNWDYVMDADKPEPSIAYAWLFVALNTTWSSVAEKAGLRLGYHELLHVLRLEMLEYMLKTSKGGEYLEKLTGMSPEQLASQTLRKAIEYLEKYYGSREPRDWVWGRAHRVLIAHAMGKLLPWLNYPVEPAPGGPFTVNVAPMIGLGDPVTHGPSVRLVADMAPGATGLIVLPGGDSGHPFSKYYDNQYLDWLRGVYHPVVLASDPGDVEGVVLVLNPGS